MNNNEVKTKKLIGVCVSNTHQISVHQLLGELCIEAKERGCELQLFATFSDLYRKNGELQADKAIFDTISKFPLDAVIMFSEMIKDGEVKEGIVKTCKKMGIPVISFKESIDGCLTMKYDAESSLDGIIDHLVEKHHCSELYFITGTKGNPVAETRLRIFKDACARHNIPIDDEGIGYGDFWAGPTEKVVERFLTYDHLPDAIVCANDSMALAACDTLRRHGIQVPEDVIVTGMGGIREREFHFPLLTTCLYDPTDTSQFMFDALEGVWEGEIAPTASVFIPCRIVYSESCGCKSHDIPVFQANLQSTYLKLENERVYSHEVNDIIHAVNNSCDVMTLADLLCNYTKKPGLSKYKLYICSEFALQAGLPFAVDAAKFPYILVSSYDNGTNSILLTPISDKEFLPSLRSLKTDDTQIALFPLKAGDTYWGMLALDYDCNRIFPDLLYKFIVTINICFDMISKRYEMNLVHEQLDNLSEQTIMSLAEIVEAKSEHTGKHVKRVAEYTGVLCKALGYSAEDVRIVRIASMMHDIGKINVPSSILEKPGRLTPEEFEIIKAHAVEGEKMLSRSEGKIMETACLIAGYHHEKWNGTGYYGKKGTDIPREARIVALADVFDALVSRRPYKAPYSPQEAYNIILESSGSHFDPEIVDAFKNNFDKFVAIQISYMD